MNTAQEDLARQAAGKIIAECEAFAVKHYPFADSDFSAARCHLGLVVGALEYEVRKLCDRITELESAAGIADSISRLPSKHEDLTLVLDTLHHRMDAESGATGSYGFDLVTEHLEDACCAMTECTWVDADELALFVRAMKTQE